MPPATGVRLMVGDKERVLRLTHQGIAVAEERTKRLLPELFRDYALGGGTARVALLQATLLHSERGLTFDAAAALCDIIDRKEMDDAIHQVIREHWGLAPSANGDDNEGKASPPS